MSSSPTPIEIFFSYAHEDEPFRAELEKHLSLLRRQGVITAWHDRQIDPGADWTQEIDTHLERASVILLLVSADFLASDYCYGIEMKRALERHQTNEARVIPILLRPVDWRGAPFAHLQALPTNAKEITTWDNRDAAFADVAGHIRQVVNELQTRASVHQENLSLSPLSVDHSNAVLFDEGHGQSRWKYPMAPTINDGYIRLKELTQQHYTVEFLKEAVSAIELRKYAAFVLPIGPEGLSHLKDEELDAIRDHVRQGGGLLVLGYYTGDWHHEANFNKVLDSYGITFNNDVAMPKDATAVEARLQLFKGPTDSEYVVVAQPAADDHVTNRIGRELLAGVRQVATVSSCSLRIAGAATDILRSGSESTLFVPEPTGKGIAIAEYRKTGHGSAVLVGASKNHKVIAVGSWKTFLNEFIDDSNYDNRRLYENVLSWLMTKRD